MEQQLATINNILIIVLTIMCFQIRHCSSFSIAETVMTMRLYHHSYCSTSTSTRRSHFPFLSNHHGRAFRSASTWRQPRRWLSSSSQNAIMLDNNNDDDVTFSTTTTTTATAFTNSSSSMLLHPEQLGDNGMIPYPKSLSPSAIMEFKKCKQSFLFQYLYGLKQPTSLALAKGSICHAALEKIFDIEPPKDRTLQVLQDLFRTEWSHHRYSDTYRILFEADDDSMINNNDEGKSWDLNAEREWGQSALKLLENYYNLEDPRNVVRPNPVKREIWLNAKLSIDPECGVTARKHNNNNSNNNHRDIHRNNNWTESDVDENEEEQNTIPTFHVRGIVDRLDMVRSRDSSSKVCLRIVDYKTGKAPNLKYSHEMNQKIVNEAFYQLKIYALLLREKGAGRQLSLKNNEMNLRLLRLLYLNSESGKAVNWDLDMGSTAEERDALLQDVHKDLSSVWNQIVELVSNQDPKAFVGCTRSFCYCHKCRPKFVPGTVWEPPSLPPSLSIDGT